MSIITNFLKLIKPEKNDYVDVEEHISNNYDKIDTWARDLVINDLENGGVDKALSANQGLILDNKDKGIVGGYNGKFPLTSATKGNIYLLENTQKYYICITDYNGSKLTTPNANFEELSVYTNRSKLDNLGKKLFEKIENDNAIVYKYDYYSMYVIVVSLKRSFSDNDIIISLTGKINDVNIERINLLPCISVVDNTYNTTPVIMDIPAYNIRAITNIPSTTIPIMFILPKF